MLRNAKFFKKKTQKWKPSNCQRQLCVDFLDGTGFKTLENNCLQRK